MMNQLDKRGLKKSAVQRSINFLLFIVIIAILAPILANEKALVVIDNGNIDLPFLGHSQWSKPDKSAFVIRAPIPYGENSIDFDNANSVSPLDEQRVSSAYYRHWFGTDELGRDVLAMLMYGSRTAIVVGFGVILLAGLIGLIIGGLAGYWGDDSLKWSKFRMIGFSIWLIGSFTLLISIPPWNIVGVVYSTLGTAVLIIILTSGITFLLFYKLSIILERRLNLQLKNVPVDLFLSRIIEIMESLPTLLIIISLSALINPSIYTVIFIIGISGWSGIARFCRAEVLKVKKLNFVESGRALGLRDSYLLFKHIIPNALPPILVSLSFGFSAAILIEATLSFLGMGIGVEEASWGSMLAGARLDYQAWWLAVFPGLAIFGCVFSCNTIGDALSKNKKENYSG